MNHPRVRSRLTPLDRGFLYLERHRQPFHVACLNLFTPPDDASPGFVPELGDRLRACARPSWPFDRRLASPYGGAWIEDPDFDIDEHFVRMAVPQPGTMDDLLRLVSDLHEQPLDRSRPLWCVYLIEGLSDGRIATYCKVHHALTDGVAGARQLLRSMSSDQRERLPPPWATRSSLEGPPHGSTLPAGGAATLLGGLRTLSRTLPAAVRRTRRTLDELRRSQPDASRGAQAPASLLNGPISASRAFAARSFSHSRIRVLCETFDCSSNDLVLALCSSALRRLLNDRNALPERPLIALVPMSTRRDDSDSGNQIVPLLVNLATDQADPVQRLATIHASATQGKDRVSGLTPAQAYGYTLMTSARGFVNLLLRPSRGNLAFNVVISKVPGPRSQLYWQGCRLDGLYPVSVVMDGLALNITIVSRHESLDFGLLACARTLPCLQPLLEYLDDALAELESRAGVSAPPRRPAARAYRPRRSTRPRTAVPAPGR